MTGRVGCPGCSGVLRPWGWARPRRVYGIGGVLRPRRGRCGGCRVTHVLLPVTVLLRRAYAAAVIGPALLARAGGHGCRWIGAVTGRFGPFGVLGVVTAWQVAVACSAGRLLAPGWPAAGGWHSATRVASDVGGG